VYGNESIIVRAMIVKITENREEEVVWGGERNNRSSKLQGMPAFQMPKNQKKSKGGKTQDKRRAYECQPLGRDGDRRCGCRERWKIKHMIEG
jgi:hypothetical protein